MGFNKRLAYWMSDKKSHKVNWDDFIQICQKYGFELFKLDLNKNINSQGPITVFLHKLTDIIAAENQGDPNCSEIIAKVEDYISSHDKLIVIDPIENVRQLLNRYKAYSIIERTDLHKFGVFTPNFCEIKSNNVEDISEILKEYMVTYPLICKPKLGHGSKKAHEMLIIFNKEGLSDCRAPCVAQSFINHNAVLFKIFIVAEKFYFVERPSLKNFYASNCKSISFDSGEVSKAGAQSNLNVLDEVEEIRKIIPNNDIFEKIAMTLRKAFGMDLLGVDVVIENDTGRYGIIDVNAYPGYDGFPNFYETLLQYISKKVDDLTENTTECDKPKFPNTINDVGHTIFNNIT